MEVAEVVSMPPPLPPKTKPRYHSPPRISHHHATTSATLTPRSSASSATSPTVPTKPAIISHFGERNEDDIAEDSRYHEAAPSASPPNHVVKIQIFPQESPCIRISVNETEMIHQPPPPPTTPFFYYSPYMSSGQVSPSDTLDSGTCSDLDATPPPTTQPASNQKKSKKNAVSVTLIGGMGHKRAPSSTSSGADLDSDDNESSLSCDSLNCKGSLLPATLLQDIRRRDPKIVIDEKSYEDRVSQKNNNNTTPATTKFDTDCFYNFHINECDIDEKCAPLKSVIEDETFAGYKDLLSTNGSSTIRSAKGTVRGVKNRVRAGIATFLQINNSTIKSYIEKEEGKVVVYSTSLGVLRNTFEECMKVKKILRTLLIKFDEKDVFMSREYQEEIKERMRCDQVLVPQVFVGGQHVGDAATIEILNESGELRKMLKPFKSQSVLTTCSQCGGYRLLPCSDCNGSKKSVHRNDFTSEFVALKCMKCDEVGLVKCRMCCS